MALENVRDKMNDIRQGLCKVIFGQDEILDQLLTCFLAGGHVLLEGIPGLGKTLLARVFGKTSGRSIQEDPVYP